MLRLQDFRCASHGNFEVMLNLDPREGDKRFDAVRSHACPTCGEAAPGVWTKAPAGRMGDRVHVVDIGGRTMTRDSIEERLATTHTPTQFWNKPGFEGGLLDRVDKYTAKYYAGELPSDDHVSDADLADIQTAVANTTKE
jgi:hypothetical protein